MSCSASFPPRIRKRIPVGCSAVGVQESVWCPASSIEFGPGKVCANGETALTFGRAQRAPRVTAIVYVGYLFFPLVSILWLICLFKAFRGEVWQAPVIGKIVANMASKP